MSIGDCKYPDWHTPGQVAGPESIEIKMEKLVNKYSAN